MDTKSQASIFLSPRKKLRDHGKQYSLDLSLHAPRPRGCCFTRRDVTTKQGSLDSKIEEIFDTSSFESDPSHQNDDVDVTSAAAAESDESKNDDVTRQLVEGMARDGLRVPFDGDATRMGKSVRWVSAPVVNGHDGDVNGHGSDANGHA